MDDYMFFPHKKIKSCTCRIRVTLIVQIRPIIWLMVIFKSKREFCTFVNNHLRLLNKLAYYGPSIIYLLLILKEQWFDTILSFPMNKKTLHPIIKYTVLTIIHIWIYAVVKKVKYILHIIPICWQAYAVQYLCECCGLSFTYPPTNVIICIHVPPLITIQKI